MWSYHISSNLLGEDFPDNLNDLRLADLSLREANFKTVPELHNLAICQLLALNTNPQLFSTFESDWKMFYTCFDNFCFVSPSFLSSGFLADLVFLILTSVSSLFMMMESMNVLRLSPLFPFSEAVAAFLVFFFFDTVKR